MGPTNLLVVLCVNTVSASKLSRTFLVDRPAIASYLFILVFLPYITVVAQAASDACALPHRKTVLTISPHLTPNSLKLGRRHAVHN